MLRHPCVLGDSQQRGTTSQVAALPLPCRGPQRGQKCYVTPAFSGVPNAKRGKQNQVAGSQNSEVVPNKGEQYQKWLPHTCLLRGPKEGRIATSPLHSRGSPMPSAGSKIRSGCLIPNFTGAQKRAEMLRHPCILGDPQQQARGAKSEVVPNMGEQNHKWLPHPYLLGGPKEGRNATSPLHSRGSPMPSAGSKIRSGPQQRGTISEVAASPLPCRGPKRGRKCYVTLAFSGTANKGEQNQKWLPCPCLVGGPKEGRNATSPLHSRGSPTPSAGSQNQKWSPTKGNKIRSGCLRLTFPRAQRRVEMLRHPCILGGPQRPAQGAKSEVVPKKGEQYQKWSPTKGNNIRSGCLTLAFSGAQKRAELEESVTRLWK